MSHSYSAILCLLILMLGAGVIAQSAYAQTSPTLNISITADSASTQTLATRLQQELAISLLKNDAHPAQTDFLFRQTQDELQQLLKAHGYYQAQIDTQLIREPEQTQVRISLVAGEPVRTRRININISGDGEKLNAWQDYLQYELPMRRDKIFTHQDYESTLRSLLNIANNNGYLDAKFIQRQFEVNPYSGEVRVNIHLDTGAAYQFGEVRFQGSERLNPDFLQTFVEFDRQQNFNQADLLDLQQNLIGSRYFGLVRVTPALLEQQDRHIPVQVDLEDNLPHRYKIGAGYGTDTGARALIGFENRLLNQHGHRYEVDTLIGERKQAANFQYGIPGKRPSRQQWIIGAGWDATQSRQLKRSRFTLTPEYAYQMDNDWIFKPFVSLERERFTYKSQDPIESQLLISGAGLQKRVANNDLYPTIGYRHHFSLRGSFANLVSDSEFVQMDLASKGVYSPLESLRLLARGRMVVTYAEPDQIIPSTYRYLLGGENLRGFEFESIGIANNQGQIEGAKNMTQVSLETDYRFSRYVGAALFTDIGQAFNDEPAEKFKQGAGVGIRGFTPVGIIRADIAWPVSEQEQPWRFHLSIGLDL